MPRRSALALLLTLLCASAIAEERRYLQLTTDELTLVSSVSESRTRQIAAQVGMFRAAVEQVLGLSLPAALPTRIYALSSEDWARYAQPRPGVAGYFLPHPFSSDLLFDAGDELSGAYELVFHEYMHYILRATWGGRVPAYLDEGLAEAFGSASFRDGTLMLEPRADYLSYLRSHEWMPFERLFSVKRHDAEYVDHALAPAFYAQAWATAYYALATRPGFGASITAYVHDLESGAAPVPAADRLVGGVSTLEHRDMLRTLQKHRRVPIAQIPAAERSKAAAGRLRALEGQESTFELGELLLRMSGRHRQALEVFEEVKEQCPLTARACVGLGWSHLQAGDTERAASLFDRAAAAGTMDRRTAVDLGRGLFQVAAAASQGWERPSGTTRDRLIRARTLFESAIQDDSTRLEAVNGYVLARIALDERDASLVSLAQSAYRLAPNSSELAVGLALLHELDGKKDIARGYWRQAARNTHTGPMRARILDALNEAESGTPPPAR